MHRRARAAQGLLGAQPAYSAQCGHFGNVLMVALLLVLSDRFGPEFWLVCVQGMIRWGCKKRARRALPEVFTQEPGLLGEELGRCV